MVGENWKTRIGQKLREYRKQKGLTQKELAEAAGVSKPTVTKIETGASSNLTVSTLTALAEALGREPSEFLAPSGEAPTSDIMADFYASPFAALAELDDADKAWLESQDDIKWLGHKPEPKDIYAILQAWRQNVKK